MQRGGYLRRWIEDTIPEIYLLQALADEPPTDLRGCDLSERERVMEACRICMPQRRNRRHALSKVRHATSVQNRLLAAACWPEDLIHDLRWIDAQASSPERLFTVATVKVGPHTGLRAVGIATNQKRLKSASNLALAFAGKLFQLFFVTLACTCFSFLHVGAPAKGCLEIVQNIRWISARTTATHSAPLRGTTMW